MKSQKNRSVAQEAAQGDQIRIICEEDLNSAVSDRKGEIKALWDKAGIDVHELKPGAGYDLYKTPTGEIVVKPKGGAGPGDPTGINIKDIMGGG